MTRISRIATSRIALAVAAAMLAAPAAVAQQQQENIGQQALRQLLQGQQQDTGSQDEQVRRLLEDRGYTDVGDIQRVYRTTARRDGRDVTLTIDAETGQIYSDRTSRPQSARSDQDRGHAQVRSRSEARAVLQDEGYDRISNVRREGSQYVAEAERNGQQVSVAVDRNTGEVQELD